MAISCDLTVDVMGEGLDSRYAVVADLEVRVELDAVAYAWAGVQIEDVLVWGYAAPQPAAPFLTASGRMAAPVTVSDSAWARPPQWLAHAVAKIINSSPDHRRRIEDAIRDAGDLARRDEADARIAAARQSGGAPR